MFSENPEPQYLFNDNHTKRLTGAINYVQSYSGIKCEPLPYGVAAHKPPRRNAKTFDQLQFLEELFL